MPLKKALRKVYDFGLPPLRPKTTGASLGGRSSTIFPATNLAGTFATLPTNTVLFTPFFIPIQSRIRGWHVRTSSQTSVWGQPTLTATHTLNICSYAPDKITGLPATPLQTSVYVLQNTTATNTQVSINFGFGQTAEAGLYWMGFINSSGTTFSLAGVQPSSGDRTNAGQVLFQKAIGQNSTGSIFPYGLALGVSGTSFPLAAELSSAVLQYNTSAAAQGFFRLRTNVPWVALQLDRVD